MHALSYFQSRRKNLKMKKNLEDESIKIISLRLVLAWLIALLSLIIGVIALFNGHLNAILLLLFPFVTLPPLNNIYKNIFCFRISMPLKIVLVLTLWVLFLI